MITATPAEVWTLIGLMGVLTFLIRFSFLGLLGERELPDWVQRHLRYTAVAVLPALITPLVLWPDATGGRIDPIWLGASAATLITGYLTRNALWAIFAGFGAFYGLSALLG